MKVCPKCNARIEQATVRGPLVWATASVIFQNGVPTACGPIVAQSSIKPGHEITAKGVVMDCPECSYSGALHSFRDVSVCYMSGEELSEPVLIRMGDSVVTVAPMYVDVVQAATNLTLGWYQDWSGVR